MCYNISDAHKKKAFNEKWEKKQLSGMGLQLLEKWKNESPDLRTEVSGFTHPEVLVVCNNKPELIDVFRWGLQPSFGYNTLNARSESIQSSKLYRPYANNRCLIAVHGFYEWQHLDAKGNPDAKGKKTQKYFIRSKEENLLSLGGLFSESIDKETGELLRTFTILTKPANTFMANIHNTKLRMPIILSSKDEEKWLSGSNDIQELELISELIPK